jgi:dTDP-4-dehydrorhamnose 3,5-epimerase
MTVKITTTSLPEVLILEPEVLRDTRGFFMESYTARAFNAAVGAQIQFVQDNHSRSARGVLRGLHYQQSPYAQGKLVRVAIGRVFDVAVDVRYGSAHFGHSVGIELSGENHRQVWIPPGFAHGFLVLSDSADLLYKTTAYYNPDSERAVRWNDPQVNIQWPIPSGLVPTISMKDAVAPVLADAEPYR